MVTSQPRATGGGARRARARARLVVVAILCAASAGCGDDEPPVARRGVADLSRHDWRAEGTVTLSGEWELYWRELLEPGAFPVPAGEAPHHIELVRLWTGHTLEGEKLPGDGFASFRLLVETGKSGGRWGLRVPPILSAHKLWVNGALVAELGVVGDSPERTRPEQRPYSVFFESTSPTVEIVLQISNFNHSKGGTETSFSFGEQEAVLKARELDLVIGASLVGALLVMALYHFALFLLRRSERSTLYFGFVCLLVGYSKATLGETAMSVLLPSFPWELWYKAGYTSAHLSLAFILLFVAQVYPGEVSPRFVKPVCAAAFAFCAFVLATPVKVFTSYAWLYELIVANAAAVYVVWALLLAARRGRRGALFMGVGGILFAVAGINDVLVHAEVVTGRYLLAYGLFGLVLSQSFGLALRFSRAFTKVERLSQRLLSLDKLKDEFLANTSHELRTPLHGIIGLAESLIDGAAGKLPSRAVASLSSIASSGRRLSNLVNDILDFSRLKNRELRLERAPVDLKAMIDKVLALSRYLLKEKGIALENAVGDDARYVLGDENRLEQILFNLVGNAIKFTESGRVLISTRAVADVVELTVEDTGIGIPEDRLEDVFKSFEQVDSSDARRFGGAGLGLSITRQLVELHGGRVWIESRLGLGTEVKLTLPASPVAPVTSKDAPPPAPIAVPMVRASDDEPEGAPSPAPRVGASRFRILAVDDEPVNLQVLTNFLGLQGYETTTASSGPEALRALEDDRFDLVLLDVAMPGMSGHEVCRALRERHPLFELPVLMLTAKGRPGDVVQGFESGANDYVTKPFDRAELSARVHTLLALRSAIDTALMNARHLESEVSRRRLAEALHGLSAALGSTLETTKIAEVLLDKLADVVAYDRAFVLGRDGGPLVELARRGFAEGDALDAALAALVKECIENDVALHVRDAAADLRTRSMRLGDTRSLLVTPIPSWTEPLGALVLESDAESAYEGSGPDLVAACARQAAAAIENAQLFEKVRTLAARDELTGLNNRRRFFELAEQELRHALRYGRALSLFLIDVDFFKKINDTHGHQAGDDVLRGVSATCRETLRKPDVAGRYGGEELAVLLPETGLDAAFAVAERLRETIAERSFATKEGASIGVTVSVGVAALSDEVTSLEGLIERADRALYEAKDGGRNQTRIASLARSDEAGEP